MTSYLPGLLIAVALAVVALGLMTWGWAKRKRRDASIAVPLGTSAQPLRTRLSGLHVATTRRDAPMDRVVVAPLGYRAAIDIAVSATDLQLDFPGGTSVLLGRHHLQGAGRATWTIDRVVESGGLVLIAWQSDDGTVLDTYLRVQDGDPAALIAAVESVRTPSTPTTGASR